MRISTAASIAIAVALGAPAIAATPKNALGAIAVSPDGATLIAAGDNRVLYVLDPASLEVKQRVAIGINPQEAVFSSDGQTLAILDHDADVHLYATADWSLKQTVQGDGAFSVSPAADSFVLLGRASAEGTPFAVYTLGDGAKKLVGSIAGEASAIAAAVDGSSYTVLLERVQDAGEPKQDAPKELKGLDLEIFKQKNDGYTSEVVTLDASGAETGRSKSWYSTTDALTGAVVDGAAWFFGYQNKNVHFTGGDAQLLVLAPSYLYGAGLSGDRKWIAAGSLRDGTLYSLADGTAFSFELDKMAGWPEYFEGFAFAPDGTVYGGTTAWRLAKVGADGKLLDVKPIY